MNDPDYQKFYDENKRLWDNRVAHHVKSELYDMPSFLSGKSSLQEIERDALGDVSGKKLLHLQCHFGQDTLSLARQGALATGVDFSEKAIEKARSLNTKLRLNAQFVVSNVYNLPDVLEGEFDVVFTTYGAIPWLPDLEKWAKIVGHFLKKGGVFYLAEFHPTLYLFNFDTHKIEYGYFTEKAPYEETVEGSYADPEGQSGSGKEYFWNHSLSEVVNPLTAEGLRLLELKEYDFSPYNCFPNMKEVSKGRYVWGTEFGVRLPHIFSLKMQKQE